MALTSEDVVNWQLKTGMRGYLVPQVDELLDEVADELDGLHARIRELEAEREAVRNSLDEQFEVEETLRRTLYQAQKAADQTIADARAAAEKLHADATMEADDIVATATKESARRIEQAIASAEDEGNKVRSRLRAQEARMRAVGSQLRRNLLALHALEQETRDLLRGVHEDRLRELERNLVDLPDFDDDEIAAQGFVDTPIEVESSGEVESSVDDEFTVEEPDVAEAMIPEPEQPEHEEPQAEVVEVVADRVDAADDPVAEPLEDPVAEAGDEPEDSSPGEPAPPYISAVSDALATIATNQTEDLPMRRSDALSADPFDDDLLDDVDPVLADDPGLEHLEGEAVQTSPTADLFGDQQPRRRRRSG